MLEKYLESHFGTCPRALCENQNVLPVGMSDELKKSRVKVSLIHFSLTRSSVQSAAKYISQLVDQSILMEPTLELLFLIHFYK